jgi:hypothetical protein
MKKYLPEKNFKIQIVGIFLLILIPSLLVLIIFPFIIPIKNAILANLLLVTMIGGFLIVIRNMLPYGIFTISEKSIEQYSFGLHKKIRFDEVTEIHQVEITSPHTYYGKYCIYIKSRDSKIKLCDLIQDYKSLINDVLNNCGKDTFEYREDTMNKYWIRKW